MVDWGAIQAQVAAQSAPQTLTPSIANDLMYRSMTTGTPTSEFDKYGGYDKVASMFNQNGGQYSLSAIPDSMKTTLAQQVANTGTGNLSILKETNTPLSLSGVLAMSSNGIDSSSINKYVNDYGVAGFATSSQLDALQNKYNTLNGNYGNLNNQLTTLQAAYDALSKKSGSGTGGTVSGSGVVDTSGSTINNGSVTSPVANGTTGVVYGPDGKSYSSAAAAIAAGITNYSYTKPTFPSSGNQPGLITGADSLNAAVTIPNSATGNANPGANIPNTNKQLFNVGAPQLKLPSNVINPFQK